MPPLTVETWVDSMQARGRYTFLRSEAISGSGLSAEAVKKALQRLARRQRVAKVKSYFYVVVPLEYLHAGAPPPSWFIDDLMKAMERPYYVGLLSAASIHGASHQQPQEFQVLTDRPIRPLEVGRARIRFFVNKRCADTAVQSVKTPTGMMRVSTPESTAVDLVRLARVAGHLDNVATVLMDLAPLLDPKRLLKVVRASGDLPNAQRLGSCWRKSEGARRRRRFTSGLGVNLPVSYLFDRGNPLQVGRRTGDGMYPSLNPSRSKRDSASTHYCMARDCTLGR